MLSIAKCYEVLNKGERKYAREEVIAIRDYLYGFVSIIDQVKTVKDE